MYTVAACVGGCNLYQYPPVQNVPHWSRMKEGVGEGGNLVCAQYLSHLNTDSGVLLLPSEGIHTKLCS